MSRNWTIALLVTGLFGCTDDVLPDRTGDTSQPDTTVATGDTGGTVTTNVTDTFVASSQKVDVILVIDNSPGMATIQPRLYSRGFYIMERLGDLDFRIGSITTDTDNGTAGALHQLSDGSTSLSSETKGNPLALFTELVAQGDGGSSTERGLAALYAMLGPKAPATTVDFYRPDAAMHVLVLSDEDDASADDQLPDGSYASWLRSLKPDGQPITFSSFVSFDTFSTGQRYLDITEELGGVSHDIDADSPSWDAAVDLFGSTVARNLPLPTFHLTSTPLPATIAVAVRATPEDPPESLPEAVFDGDGGVVSGGWSYEAGRNVIELHRFLLEPGAVVEVAYDTQL